MRHWRNHGSGVGEEESAGLDPNHYDMLPPENAIHPDRNLGSCWPMRGRKGSLGIVFPRPVAVSAFTIDHVPKGIALNPGTAPRSGELWGLVKENTAHFHTTPSPFSLSVLNSSTMFQRLDVGAQAKKLYGAYDFVKLGTFAYDLDSYIPFQTFHVPAETVDTLADTRFDTVLLVISDNWGSEDYTCLYSIRVHPK